MSGDVVAEVDPASGEGGGVEDYDYPLPDSAIAQTGWEPRDGARLLVDRGPTEPPAHRNIHHLPGLLGPGDVVVVNETRVRPARLHLVKPTGGQVEVLVLERDHDGDWTGLVRPGRRVAPGTALAHPARPGEPIVRVGEDRGDGRRRLQWVAGSQDEAAVDAALADLGEVPQPPYVERPPEDPERYQTVFARRPGSAAAPTAGLHLTERTLEAIEAAGAAVLTVDLEVGIDTFRPMRGPSLDDHAMHAERYRVARSTLDACAAAERVVAIGTTTVRALEAAVRGPLEGRTDLFIRPGFEFVVVDAVLTNFHSPRSSLLVMVEALIGPRWRGLYEDALAEGYRFLSFGDAMVIARDGVPVR